MIEDASITCPYCWESVALEIDLSIEDQDYIEDCPVCCNPMRIVCHVANGILEQIRAASTDE